MLKETKKIVVEAYHPKPGDEVTDGKTYPEVNNILSQSGFETTITNDKWVFGQR